MLRKQVIIIFGLAITFLISSCTPSALWTSKKAQKNYEAGNLVVFSFPSSEYRAGPGMDAMQTAPCEISTDLLSTLSEIKNQLKDPSVSEWVEGKFYSKDLFLKGISYAPEDTLHEIQQSLIAVQRSGGDLETATTAMTWVLVILGLVSLVILASI